MSGIKTGQGSGITEPNSIAPRVGRTPLIVCPVLSGLLIWVSFWLPWLVWVAIVPICLLVRMNGDRRWIYFGSYLGGLAWFLPGVQWIRYSDASAWMGWLALATYLAIYFPLFVFFTRVLNRRWQVPMFVAVPIVWVALEYIRSNALTGFGWMLLAHSIHEWLWTIQIADVAGVYGVSLLVALVNAFFVELLTTPLVRTVGSEIKISSAIRWRAAVTFVCLICNLMYGWFRVNSSEFSPGPRVALVQTNLPQSLKHTDDHKTLDQSVSVTERIEPGSVDLIIWPETSYPFKLGAMSSSVTNLEVMAVSRARFGPRSLESWGRDDEERGRSLREEFAFNDQRLTAFASSKETPILIGALRELYHKDRLENYNSAILYAPKLGVRGIYDKIHLVPFGEFVPLYDTVPILRKLVPYENVSNGLDASTDFRTIHLDKLNFACLICFEDTTPYVTRGYLSNESLEKPIDFLVSQCNDGWFRGSIESDLHLAASIFRCIEGRVPMVRSANMAVTGMIDGNGRLVTRLPTFAHEYLVVQIPLDPRRGPYIELGDWLPLLCCTVIVIGLLASIIRHVRNIMEKRRSAT